MNLAAQHSYQKRHRNSTPNTISGVSEMHHDYSHDTPEMQMFAKAYGC
eukprot:CAMPEP_0203932384 /NCGR_PEP_ID=MMETSP0359-20131031/70792_1 /ASSEMBLY_ACC=CAM_ASM_000338 /TAXON_ID=268821 /ORGANISM="Scrippsiella Hangoei, Strain SHTV-5" /LENGTH=47 /DNA_ID= /DNA_START= /DNA_END= /DNA_ORIENTATION=